MRVFKLFSKIFGEDQIRFLEKGRVKQWSDETVIKALKLRYAAGTRGDYIFFTLISGYIPARAQFSQSCKKVQV